MCRQSEEQRAMEVRVRVIGWHDVDVYGWWQRSRRKIYLDFYTIK